MIIVEGPDGSGKTTLCKMLEAAGIVKVVLDSPRLVAKGNIERMKYETKRYLRNYGPSQDYVVDRFLFSEMAYGPVLRGKSTFSTFEYLATVMEIQLFNSFIIFCLPNELNYKANESPVIIEKMPLIRPIYEKMCEDIVSTYPLGYRYQWDRPNAFSNLQEFIHGRNGKSIPREIRSPYSL